MARVAARRTPDRARARAVAAPLPRRRLGGLARFAPSGRSLLVAFLILALGAGGYAAARETSMFAVTAIDVVGARQPLAGDVRAALRPLGGESLAVLDRDAIEARLAPLAWVAGFRYDRAFPHTLRVWIEPERPVAVLRRGADAWLVSARGRVLQSAARTGHPRLPRVWLPASAQPRVGRTAPAEARPAVNALAPAAGLPFLRRVRAAKVGERAVTLVLRSGVEVRLGEPVDIPLKLDIARRLLPSVAAPAYLDLSVPERPVVGGNPQVEG